MSQEVARADRDRRRTFAFATALMFGAMILWVVIETIFKTLDAYHPLQVVWVRYAIHLVLVLALAPLRRRGRDRPFYVTERPLMQGVRALMMLVMPVAYVVAHRWMPHMNDTMAVFWLAPIAMVLLARAMLGERAGPAVWAVLLAAYGGTLLMFHPGPGVFGVGSLFALAMGGSMAAYFVMTRVLGATDSIVTDLFYSGFVVFVVLTPTLPVYWTTPGPGDLARMAAIGVLGLVVLAMVEKAMHAARAVDLAPVLFVQPVVTFAGLELLARGRAGALPWIGALIAGICAVALVVRGWRRRPRTADEGPSLDLSSSEIRS